MIAQASKPNIELDEQLWSFKSFSKLFQQAHYTHMQLLATIAGQNKRMLERRNQIR
jgi:hypothetical protein